MTGSVRLDEMVCVEGVCMLPVSDGKLCLCRRHYIEHASAKKKANECLYCHKKNAFLKNTCAAHDPYREKIMVNEAITQYQENIIHQKEDN